MAAALEELWTARNFFPPQPVEIPESPVPAAIAQRLWGDDYDQCERSIPSPVGVPAAHLDAQNPEHILVAAQRLVHGGIVLATANGHVVCLADADRPELLPTLASISGRPHDEISLLCAPEWLSEHIDMEALAKLHSFANMMKFSQELTFGKPLLLGLKLPASAESGAPEHLVHKGAIVSMWTEHKSIRDIFTHVRYSGERALMAVSLGSAEFDKALATSQQLGFTFLHDSPPYASQGRICLLDFSGEYPLLISQGGLSIEDIENRLLRWNLGTVSQDK